MTTTHIVHVSSDPVKTSIMQAVTLAKHHGLVVKLTTIDEVQLKVWPNSSPFEVWQDYCLAQGLVDTIDVSKLREYLLSDKFKAEGELQGYVHIQDVLNRLGE